MITDTKYATTVKCELHQCFNCGEMYSPKLSLKLMKKDLLKEMKKYQCDFNWDFEKNKAKHKSYIALDKILEILEKA